MGYLGNPKSNGCNLFVFQYNFIVLLLNLTAESGTSLFTFGSNLSSIGLARGEEFGDRACPPVLFSEG